MHGLTIGQLAQKGAVGVETIRFYQRRGLMPTPPKGEGVRRYDDQDVKRLRFIRSAQQAGFTLTQIAELIGLDDRQDRARVLELATARLTEIDARIRELETVRSALRGLTRSCASGQGETCPILHAFEA
ncbi:MULTISPECIES: MerR family transcriptional regulator [unclassified Brevundimonas]|uniref:MerR family transcriptional regulator n=1 Tax=unclassified Brevundimonas TaxID=2622653 RepID=UPI0025C57A34|nr:MULTISPECIES: MerR family transcriptional regulator [unclassified Brevundimonas]